MSDTYAKHLVDACIESSVERVPLGGEPEEQGGVAWLPCMGGGGGGGGRSLLLVVDVVAVPAPRLQQDLSVVCVWGVHVTRTGDGDG